MADKHKEESVDDEASGYDIYQKLCSIMGWENDILFYFGGAKTFEIIYEEKVKSLKLQQINIIRKDIEELLGKPTTGKLIKYIMTKKAFRATPHLVKEGFLCHANQGTPEGFVFRKEVKGKSITEMQEWMSSNILDINYRTGEITSNIPMAKVLDSNPKYIEKMFKILFPNKKERKAIKEFCALYTFEDRYGISKPTLVMYGARSTGKNLFIEHFLGNIYPGQIQPAPPNIKDFNAALDNKGLLYDEKTEKSTGKDSNQFYDELKKMSGSRSSAINIKKKEVFNIRSGCYIFIASQEKPFHLRDEIQSSSENQFLIINMPVSNTDEIAKLNLEVTKIKDKHYSSLSEFFTYNIGAYIWDELFDVYKQMKVEAKNRAYRYGMEVPITAGLLDIQAKSVTDTERLCAQIMEDLYYSDQSTYNLDGLSGNFFNFFSKPEGNSQKGFLATKVKTDCLKSYKISGPAFIHFLEKYGLKKTEGAKRKISVGNLAERVVKWQIGLTINYSRLEDLIKDNSWFIGGTKLKDPDSTNEIDVTNLVNNEVV